MASAQILKAPTMEVSDLGADNSGAMPSRAVKRVLSSSVEAASKESFDEIGISFDEGAAGNLDAEVEEERESWGIFTDMIFLLCIISILYLYVKRNALAIKRQLNHSLYIKCQN